MFCFALLGSGVLLPAGVGAQREAPVISEIRVRGNQITEETLIRLSCGLSVGRRLQQEETGRAIHNLYKLGLFSDIQIFYDLDVENKVVVEIVVEEYPKLGSVGFEGNRGIKSRKLKKKLGLIPGQSLRPQDKKRGRNRIVELYREEGYLLAEAEAVLGESDEDGRTPLVFNIREGEKVKLRRIRFLGNEAFPNSKLRKQMKETKQA